MTQNSGRLRGLSAVGGMEKLPAGEIAGEESAPRAEVLARRLEAMIRSGAVQPGSRLGTKDELRRQFGIAVGTLNELLRVLDMRGVIESRPGPGGGVFVVTPSPRVRLSHLIPDFKGRGINVKDSLVVRNSLELPVALEAAQYRTARDLKELHRILEEMEKRVDETGEYLKQNWAFHQQMAAICRNELLRGLYSALLDLIEEELDTVSSAETFDAHRNVRVHKQLLTAVETRRRDAIETAVRRHTPTILEVPSTRSP